MLSNLRKKITFYRENYKQRKIRQYQMLIKGGN